jgi:MYXO-CTERM domain-containing protein
MSCNSSCGADTDCTPGFGCAAGVCVALEADAGAPVDGAADGGSSTPYASYGGGCGCATAPERGGYTARATFGLLAMVWGARRRKRTRHVP